MEMYTLFINARRETSSERETTETTRNSREGLFSPRDDGISRFTGGREGAGEWAHRAHKTQSGVPRRERCRQKRFGFDENLRARKTARNDQTRKTIFAYHERNRFRSFRFHRRVDGFFHSFGEIVRFYVFLDGHFPCCALKNEERGIKSHPHKDFKEHTRRTSSNTGEYKNEY